MLYMDRLKNGPENCLYETRSKNVRLYVNVVFVLVLELFNSKKIFRSKCFLHTTCSIFRLKYYSKFINNYCKEIKTLSLNKNGPFGL